MPLSQCSTAARLAALTSAPELTVRVLSRDDARRALVRGRVVLVVSDEMPPQYEYDPTQPESRAARLAVDAVLQAAAGREDVFQARKEELTEPGARYVDFLVPGLLGMNLTLEGLLHGGRQYVDVHGLVQVGKGPELQRLSPFAFRAMTGQDNDFDIGIGLLDAAQNLNAVDSRHFEVQDYHIRLPLLDGRQSLLAVENRFRLHVTHLQPAGQRIHKLLFIVDKQYPEFFHTDFLHANLQ